MAEVLVRYTCDGCGRLAKTEEELTHVDERYYVGGDDTFGMRSHRRMYCKPCLSERENPGVPSVNDVLGANGY